MQTRRKNEIKQCLKEIKSYAYHMSRAIERDDATGEEMGLKLIKSELKLMEALYEDLQKLRGS